MNLKTRMNLFRRFIFFPPFFVCSPAWLLHSRQAGFDLTPFSVSLNRTSFRFVLGGDVCRAWRREAFGFQTIVQARRRSCCRILCTAVAQQQRLCFTSLGVVHRCEKSLTSLTSRFAAVVSFLLFVLTLTKAASVNRRLAPCAFLSFFRLKRLQRRPCCGSVELSSSYRSHQPVERLSFSDFHPDTAIIACPSL